MASAKNFLIVTAMIWLVAGCTDIVPGLLVHGAKENEAGSRYRIEERNGKLEAVPNSVESQQAGDPTTSGYRLIHVDGQAVAENRRQIESYADAESQILPGILPSTVPPEYKVGPSDIIYVTVWDHPELTTPNPNTGQIDSSQQGRAFLPNGLVVDTSGSVYFPYVGNVKVSELSCSAIRALFTERLSRVLVNPQVDVKVSSYRSSRVLITGEVKNPGTVNLDDTPKGVLDAIAAVGGLAATASRRQVMLFRNGNAYRVNLAGLLSGSHLVTNPALQAGDVIHVPSQTIDQIFMLGQVSRSQPIVVQQNTISLVEALTTVGGVDRVNAKGSGILVFRLPQEAFVASNRVPAERERLPASIFLFDLSRPEGMLLASEFQLLPQDVVYVDSTLLSKYNSIIASLLPTVNSLFYAAEINQLTRNNNF